MNKSNVYIFLDWFMTINELISDGKVNEKKFNVFSAAIKRLENASGLCAHLVVVSGTREESAKKVFSLLKPEFDRAGICFDGFAFEYGGYMIEGSGAIKRIYAEKTDLGQEIEKLKNKFSIEQATGYKLYYCFEFEKMTEKEERFIAECKRTFKNHDFETYNDQYGIGMDIKNSDLNKAEFIKTFLRSRQCEMLIVGGDSNQDLVMLSYKKIPRKFFIGFKKLTKERKENIILSNKSNVCGISDAINKVSCILEEEN